MHGKLLQNTISQSAGNSEIDWSNENSSNAVNLILSVVWKEGQRIIYKSMYLLACEYLLENN